ncbi:MAG: choline-sulfatase [Chloroflexota bacterium]
MTQKPPNILLIMADQLAPHFTGTYGHPVVQTPHMDAVAARGMRFDAAYCNSPLCAPSRFSFMSGQLVTNIGAYDNAAEFPSSIPTFAHYLKQLGYKTCLSGKMHFVGADQLHGFEERVTTDIYPADFAWTPDWENADERIDRWYHNMDPVKEAGIAAVSFQLDYDDEVAFFARRKIFDYARTQDEPFCLVASFMHPHDPYVARKEFWDLYDPADIDMPKVLIDYNNQDPFSQRLMDGIQATTTDILAEDVRNSRHGYYANTSYIDAQIGNLIDALEQAQILDNTIVIITADHGDLLGERSLWYKMSFYERAVRIPLIMAGPGIAQGIVPNACSLLDMLPTLVDIAQSTGAPDPVYGRPVPGRSLMPLARGEADSVSEAIGEYCAEMTAWPVIMIRRDEYKFIYCESDPPMLFNIVEDPEEMNNLVSNPDFADIVERFTAEIHERWDNHAIRKQVIQSQKDRRAVHAAMEIGPITKWDYNPPRDASNEYVRNHIDWAVAATQKRFPPPET